MPCSPLEKVHLSLSTSISFSMHRSGILGLWIPSPPRFKGLQPCCQATREWPAFASWGKRSAVNVLAMDGRGGMPHRPYNVIGVIFLRLYLNQWSILWFNFKGVYRAYGFFKKNDGTPLNKITYNLCFKKNKVHHRRKLHTINIVLLHKYFLEPMLKCYSSQQNGHNSEVV
jgi:hypothetical protein